MQMPVSHLTFWDLPFDRAGLKWIACLSGISCSESSQNLVSLPIRCARLLEMSRIVSG